MEKTLRTRLMTAGVLVVVFCAGVLLGFAADRSLAAEPVTEVAVAEGDANPGDAPSRGPMYEQVDPTPEQKVLIDSIVRDHRQAMKALHAEFRAAYNPRYEALVQDTRTAIKGVLTPEQAQAYDSLVADYQRRRAERTSREDRE